MEKIVLEKYHSEGKLMLPSVVHTIEYERQILLDIFLHKDQLQMMKPGQELQYGKIHCSIKKKLQDKPITTGANIDDRLLIRKCRFFCDKIFDK